jgi:hypothetical protein
MRKDLSMRLAKVIQRRIRKTAGGVEYSGDVNAAIAANVGEPSATTSATGRTTAATSTEDPEAEDGERTSRADR